MPVTSAMGSMAGAALTIRGKAASALAPTESSNVTVMVAVPGTFRGVRVMDVPALSTEMPDPSTIVSSEEVANKIVGAVPPATSNSMIPVETRTVVA